MYKGWPDGIRVVNKSYDKVNLFQLLARKSTIKTSTGQNVDKQNTSMLWEVDHRNPWQTNA